MSNDIRFIRLLSGEEIIGKMREHNSDHDYIFVDVIQIVASLTETENLKITFLPFAPAADIEQLQISKNYIGFMTKPIPDVLERYLNIMSSMESEQKATSSQEPAKEEPKKSTKRKPTPQKTDINFVKAT